MKWYIERTSIRTKLENITILFGSNKPKNKRKYNEDLWHSGDEDPEKADSLFPYMLLRTVILSGLQTHLN